MRNHATTDYAAAGHPAASDAAAITKGRSPHDFHFTHPLPYGAIVRERGVQFVVFSRNATDMRLLLYDRVADRDPAMVIPFQRDTDRWGDVWSLLVEGVGPGQLYHLQADGPFEPLAGHRFDGTARLIDPFAGALAGDFLPSDDGTIHPPKCVVVEEEDFDWQGDRHLCRNLSETVIYEMHVRGFTRSPTSGVEHPGTYRGVMEKIPYLQSLGVTAVELMPVYEFPVNGWHGEKLTRPNYWGYDPIAWFAPHQGYAADRTPGGPVREFKELVRALHQAGIEVILDVVFNHTAEGDHRGPTLSLRGLDNSIYYILDANGSYYNYSGCGNTVNGNHPIVRETVFHCLRHWVLNYHVDGFRFDLASILSRDRSGRIIPNPPLVEQIAEDPLLADTKIIAEAWDAAGAYQVGSFANSRWSEWNGRYRDDVRRFWRGDPHLMGALATRLAGSSDLYEPSGRRPIHSINFITSHDGFPMNDLVSYEAKHNEANGEVNRDGDNYNYSYNGGVEGPTDDPQIERLRRRRIKNMLATLLLSQGVPMLLSGDECRRTQGGNNNAYCQDNETNWFDWTLVEKHADLFRFTQLLIAFRRNEPAVRREEFLRGHVDAAGEPPDVAWFSPEGWEVDWHDDSGSLTCLFNDHGGGNGAHDAGNASLGIPRGGSRAPRSRHLLMLMHSGDLPRLFTIPEAVRHLRWRSLLDTAAPSPRDFYPAHDGPVLDTEQVELPGRSMKCYFAGG